MQYIQFSVKNHSQANILINLLKTIPFVKDINKKHIKEIKGNDKSFLESISKISEVSLKEIWDTPEEDKIWNEYFNNEQV